VQNGSPASIQSALDAAQTALKQEAKVRPAHEAAVLLGEHPAAVIAPVLMELNPGFAQDILS